MYVTLSEGKVRVRVVVRVLTYPCAVRRVVVHDDLGLSIVAPIPHNPTMIITYTPSTTNNITINIFIYLKKVKNNSGDKREGGDEREKKRALTY